MPAAPWPDDGALLMADGARLVWSVNGWMHVATPEGEMVHGTFVSSDVDSSSLARGDDRARSGPRGAWPAVARDENAPRALGVPVNDDRTHAGPGQRLHAHDVRLARASPGVRRHASSDARRNQACFSNSVITWVHRSTVSVSPSFSAVPRPARSPSR